MLREKLKKSKSWYNENHSLSFYKNYNQYVTHKALFNTIYIKKNRVNDLIADLLKKFRASFTDPENATRPSANRNTL